MTDNMQRAREPKFGDWIRGIYASERNPIRDGIYVRTTRRNHETLYELTDGKGKFWMYPKRSTERLDRPNAFDAAALRLAVPEGFVVVPREPTDEVIHHMAASLDHPSVFMGGPSERSKRAAAQAYRAMLAAAPTPQQPVSDDAAPTPQKGVDGG